MKKMLNTADAVRSWENRHAKKGGRPLRCCAIDASADSEDTEEGWAFLNTGLSCCICSRYSFSLPDTVAHAVGRGSRCARALPAQGGVPVHQHGHTWFGGRDETAQTVAFNSPPGRELE
jgi:hypothetical protein